MSESYYNCNNCRREWKGDDYHSSHRKSGHLKRKYHRNNNNHNNKCTKDNINHEVYEEQKESSEYDYNSKEKYKVISNEDVINKNNYEILLSKNGILKNENQNQNLKESKTKLEQENKNIKNSLKEKEDLENTYKSEIKENEKLKNENKDLKESKEKIEQEFHKLKNENKDLKESKEKIEQEFHKLKNENKENEKTVKDLKKQKAKNEFQIIEKEREINNLKIDKEKKEHELKILQNEKNIYHEELKKEKALIAKLEEQKLELEKFLENEKKKNETLTNLNNNLIKEKNSKLLLCKNKFEEIKKFISNISDKFENETLEVEENRNISLNEEEKEEKEEEKHNIDLKKGNGKVGIINLELNCYMSSVIQILKNIKKFSETILNFENIDDKILSSLKEFIYSLFYSKKKAISISDFKTNFSNVYKRFEGRKSNDSTYFLIYLFTYLQKILLKSKKSVSDISEFDFLNLNYNEKEELKKFLVKFESKNNSFIHDMFYYYQMSELICSGCNKQKLSFQGSNVLFLSLYDGTTKLKSLEQCINSYLYTKDKKDDKDFSCSTCGRRTLSHVISLVKLPPILIINLKRVGEEVVYSHDIDIPFNLKTQCIEKLRKFNMEYELIGFIKHYGSADDGHNIAYSKNIFDQKWYEFNDREVEAISGAPDTDKSFLLFYQAIC